MMAKLLKIMLSPEGTVYIQVNQTSNRDYWEKMMILRGSPVPEEIEDLELGCKNRITELNSIP